MNFVRSTLLFLLLAVMFAACQKDQTVDLAVDKTTVSSDTSSTVGNFLAVKGSLSIIIDDSTYTFDAAKDSIAFINADIDSNKYFGITAINKEHTISFGISSPGFAAPDLTNAIAGSQLLFSKNGEYTLAKGAEPGKYNKINLVQFMQDSVLSKGIFVTVMTSGQVNSSPKPVKGNFNLYIK